MVCLRKNFKMKLWKKGEGQIVKTIIILILVIALIIIIYKIAMGIVG